jgi:Protein of unknown function (DUF1176)
MTNPLLYLFLVASAAQGSVDEEPLQLYKDWVVGCDNMRSCHAVSLVAEDIGERPVGDDGLEISFKRDGSPKSSFRIGLSTRYDEIKPLENSSIGVLIDGGRPIMRLRARNGLLEVPPERAVKLLTAMRRGHVLSLVDDEGNYIAGASLRGFVAALSYVDTKQYRVGTTSALARPGSKPADAFSIPPMPPPAVIRVAGKPNAPPNILTEKALQPLRAQDTCLKYSEDALPGKPEYHRLDANHTLLILPTVCGGYNPASMIFVVDNQGDVKRAQVLLDHGEKDIGDDGMLTDVTWDEKARLLSSFGRGRGLADCGLIERFAWSEGRFRLTHSSSMSPCRGSYDYITTYRLDVVIQPD